MSRRYRLTPHLMHNPIVQLFFLEDNHMLGRIESQDIVDFLSLHVFESIRCIHTSTDRAQRARSNGVLFIRFWQITAALILQIPQRFSFLSNGIFSF